VKRQESLLK